MSIYIIENHKVEALRSDPLLQREEEEKARRILMEAQEKDYSSRLSAWATIGVCCMLSGNCRETELAFLGAIEAARSSHDTVLVLHVYEAAGNALFRCRDFANAVQYYEMAVEIAKNKAIPIELKELLRQLAMAHEYAGQRDKERSYLWKIITEFDNTLIDKGLFLESIALSLNASGLHEEAAKQYEEALGLLAKAKFGRFWRQRVENLAKIYTELGDDEGLKRTKARLPQTRGTG